MLITPEVRERNSSMELLRIVAMFLVMFTHANFLSGAIPLPSEENVAYATMVFFFQTLSAPCVDIFILISGYFGIRYSNFKLTSILFSVFFFLGITYIIRVVAGGG